jgi:hypothetical protein
MMACSSTGLGKSWHPLNRNCALDMRVWPRTARDVEHSRRPRNSMISRSPSSLPRNTARHTLCRGRNSHQPVLTFRQRAGEGGEAPCHPDRWPWHPQLWPPLASWPNTVSLLGPGKGAALKNLRIKFAESLEAVISPVRPS